MEKTSVNLANHPFVHGLDPRHVALLASLAEEATFLPGEYLYRQGVPAERFYLLHTGRVALQAYAAGRGGRTIDTAEAGETIGWSWFVEPYKAHFDAVALEPVLASAFSARQIRELCRSNHDIGYFVLSRLIHLMEQRLQRTHLQLLDLYGNVT